VPHTIEKTKRVRKYLDDLGHPDVYIESDGNITCENAAKLYGNGADIFVGGTSSIFRDGEIGQLIKNLRASIGWEF
jgi:ribulose-phosphate 3-epimerase